MHWRKVASLTNGAGKTEYSSVEDWNQIPVSYILLLSIQNESKILM
jgi:hypothetical protein